MVQAKGDAGRRGAALLGLFDGIAQDDDRALLHDISVPILLVSSARGWEISCAVARYIHDRIERSYLADTAVTHHFVFASRRSLVNQLIVDFWS